MSTWTHADPKRRLANLLISLAVVTVSAFPLALKSSPPANVQTELLQVAVLHPDLWLDVIVQKAVLDGSVEVSVVRLGGSVIKDLSIIAAIVAHLPARAVLPLSQMPGVRWVSLDETSARTQTHQINTASIVASSEQQH